MIHCKRASGGDMTAQRGRLSKMASTRKDLKYNIETIWEMKITIQARRSINVSGEKKLNDLEDGLEKI